MSDETNKRFLLVDVAGERACIDIAFVQEVIEQVQMTAVPMCESVVSGVMNVRGSVVPVIDLTQRLGLQAKPYDRYSCVVLYELVDDESGVHSVVGLQVNRVYSIERFSTEALVESPDFGCHIERRFIRALASFNHCMHTLLAMEQVLDIAQINQSMLASQQDFFTALRRQ
ncbi:chemotaxis protein CheW [Vibrio sp. SCSIO 43136]|uniref:chemotaxis protein CheW n=1 Tax=Vibrio sp. SCSIO 43136 TaxID=2819101 RepID=UPI0020761320|nr:chemotaxis protein CheW [Vibrio sp. SCSIO 43136]USD64252.1 purine-binding chemotaxis protein CheW [Vibrio sp. SCSIO 43136]